MSFVRPAFSRFCLTAALTSALAACESLAPPKTEPPSLEQRVLQLEHRMEMLEARPAVEPPYRSREEIEAHIEALEQERAVLLTRYFDQHPAIRDIDRRLGILNAQLKLLQQP